MVACRSYDEQYGMTGGREREPRFTTQRYLVVLTSDEECVTHEVEWSPETAAAMSALCQAINAQATWSASPRMHLNPIASTAPTGEVA